MKQLRKIYDIFSTVEKYALFVIFFFATVMVVINVLGRKLFGFSFNWLEELNRYILVICAFVGSAIAVTDDIHPKMDAVVGLFKGRVRWVVEMVAVLVFTLFLAVMTYYAFGQLHRMIQFSAMTATLKLPVYVFFAFIPLGFCGMTIRSAIKFILSVAGYGTNQPIAAPPAEQMLPEEGAADQ